MGDHTVGRTFTYDTAGRRIGTTDPDSDSHLPTRNARNRTWRYLFNRVGDLVAVRDPRGCGQDFFYDHAARLVAESYVSCAESSSVTEESALALPLDAVGLEPVPAGEEIDVLYTFDRRPDWATGTLPGSVYAGRLGGTEDRGQRSALAYDARGQVVASARQMAVLPQAIPPMVATVNGLPEITETSFVVWSRTYDTAAGHTYVRTASYDHGGRPTAMTLPIDPDYDDGTAPEIGGSLEYNARGLPSRVNLLVDEGSRAIVDELVYTRDGLVEQVTYGDDLEGDGVSSRTPTVSFTTYDDRRRPIRMRTERATNSHGELGEDRPLEDVTEPHSQMLVWDLADNLIAIEDLRDPTEWPDGFRPQSVHVTHDSLYRVAGAEYEYTQDSGTRTAVDDTSASNDWRTEMAAGRTNDPMRTAPAPLMADEPDQRVVSMTWAHDWLGNMQAWDDDSAVFYERSLGDMVNGADLPSEAPSRRTGALYVATNLPETPDTADDGGWVEVRYGEDGNALSVTVHGRCGDPADNSIALDERTPTDDDTDEAIALWSVYSCATEQHYTYAWDEVNRIALARRFDREDGDDWVLAVEQRYLYDASNQRTLKTTTFRGAESGTERTALYVYPGDFERRGLVTSMSGTSYDAVSGDTETQYGVGGARIVWRDGDRDDTLDRDQRVTIALTDLIQSTTAVIDLATGELVESGSYYAHGARETYRSNETETVTPEPMGFTGKEADEEVGLTYFGHRYLMAHLGRWASPDPLQTHAVGGGEAVNGYHYVGGNLLQARDPLGLHADPEVTQRDSSGAPTEVTIHVRVGVAVEDATERRAVKQALRAAAAWWNRQTFRGDFQGRSGVIFRFDVTVTVLSRAEMAAAGGYTPRSVIGDDRLAHLRALSYRFGMNVVGADPPGTRGHDARSHAVGGAFTLTAEDLAHDAMPTARHEIGHLLGLRDTYREDETPGPWDNNVMGRTVGLTAVQRRFLADIASEAISRQRTGVGVRELELGVVRTTDRYQEQAASLAHWGPLPRTVPRFRTDFRRSGPELDHECVPPPQR